MGSLTMVYISEFVSLHTHAYVTKCTYCQVNSVFVYNSFEDIECCSSFDKVSFSADKSFIKIDKSDTQEVAPFYCWWCFLDCLTSRITQTTGAVTKLQVIWNDKNIAISSKIRLMRSLAMSIFLYACEMWTITADIERRIQALEMKCLDKLLDILYRDHITND